MKYALFPAFLMLVTILVKADELKWSTNDSLDAVANTKVYSEDGRIGSQPYEAMVLGRDLQANPKWWPGKPLPVSLDKLTAAATNELQKQFDINPQKIASISLNHLSLVDQWIVVIEFDATDYSTAGPAQEKRVPYIVLLDGRVISPKAK